MAEKFDISTAGGAADKYEVCQQIIDKEKLRFEIIKKKLSSKGRVQKPQSRLFAVRGGGVPPFAVIFFC